MVITGFPVVRAVPTCFRQPVVNIELNPEQVARCVREIGIGFMFAPMHHTAMKHAIGPRKELGIRTIMNILGPMTNPAGVPNQVIGVFCPGVLPLHGGGVKPSG